MSVLDPLTIEPSVDKTSALSEAKYAAICALDSQIKYTNATPPLELLRPVSNACWDAVQELTTVKSHYSN